jgi:hypothetical protein
MMAPRLTRRIGPGTVARARPGTHRRVCGGRLTCRATATCVHDPGHCQLPDGRRRSSSVPGCGSSAAVLHGTPAGRTREAARKFLLRDHAPPQLRAPAALGSKIWHTHGAHVGPRRAGPWPHRPGVVAPAAAPPASGELPAGIRGLGSNAGSSAAVDTCPHTLYADRSATAVVADWHGGGTLDYHDGSPRER